MMMGFLKFFSKQLVFFFLLLLTISLTLYHLLLSNDFYLNNFEKRNTYKDIEKVVKIFFRQIIVSGFEDNYVNLEDLNVGQRAEFERSLNVSLSVIDEEMVRNIISKNVFNITSYLKGNSENLIIYFETFEFDSFGVESEGRKQETLNVNNLLSADEKYSIYLNYLNSFRNIDDSLNNYTFFSAVSALFFSIIYSLLKKKGERKLFAVEILKGYGIRLLILSLAIKASSSYLIKSYEYWEKPHLLLIASILPPLLDSIFNYYVFAAISLIISAVLLQKIIEYKPKNKKGKSKNPNIFYTTKGLAR